jgi:cullin-4
VHYPSLSLPIRAGTDGFAEDGELRRTLQSLALGKKRVLRKRTKGKDVLDSDVFEYAADFTDANPRVHIASIQAQETVRSLTHHIPADGGAQPEENTRTAGAIQAERGYTLDAAIVRIMKARRKLHYEALKAAVVDAVKSHFVPDVALIKKRITDLVEQEYMERDEEDMNVYTYVA